jgi:hypothetical protein
MWPAENAISHGGSAADSKFGTILSHYAMAHCMQSRDPAIFPALGVGEGHGRRVGVWLPCSRRMELLIRTPACDNCFIA